MSEDPVTDRTSKIYSGNGKLPNYTTEIFEDVGRSVCIAMLEWVGQNPISRMPSSTYKNIESIRKELIVQGALLPSEQVREIRKEVQKEREAMKAR